jgi:hypothetical protein
MKAQGHSSTAKAKMAHQVSTCLIDKLIASTRMGAGHQKTGRKTLGLCGQKARAGHMIEEEAATKLEVAT